MTGAKGATRRDVMTAAAALALAGFGLRPRPLFAATGLPLGELEVSVLSDGHLTLPMDFVLPQTTKEEIEALFAPHGLPTDALKPPLNVTLLRGGDRLILFDAGSGPRFQDTAGALPSALEAAGIDPSEVTDVVFTHCHPDHLWGVLDDFDEPLFAEATHWMPQDEWAYWRDEGTLAATPEARKSFVVGAQNRLAAIEDFVTLVRPGDELPLGIEALATFGHTPGHTSYVIHGGGDSLLVTGDALTNHLFSFERPDWPSGTDQDPQMGAATRKSLLERIATDRMRIVGYHLPEPGIGTAERKDGAYRFVPAA
ncbi:MBL fold metallo-hydrolase [Afifella pfennigii]|uniref:MBL fold metallo-hydrolase n=1 Tax=Afifella pfennigii TaxID=209897 RepID=UPI00054F4801|nr:MBL fold metallo-hydrolase [Afifella pfennigii]